MADEKNLNVKITSRYDGTGTEQAAAGMKKTETAAGELKKQLGDLGYSAENFSGQIKGMLTNLVAWATVVSQLKEGWEDVAVSMKAFKQLEMATAGTGENFKKVKKEVEELSDRLKVTAAVADEKSIPAIVRLYREYGNMEEATKAANLATGVAAKYGMSFEEGIQAVRAASMGNVKSLREMGIAFEGVTSATMKAETATALLVKATKGAYVDTQSMGYQVKQLSIQWDDFRADLIQQTIPALKFLVYWIRMIPDMLAMVGTYLGNAVVIWSARFEFVGKAVSSLVRGNISEIKTLWAAQNAAIAAAEKDNDEALIRLGNKMEASASKTGARIALEVGKGPKALVKDFTKATADVNRELSLQEQNFLMAQNQMSAWHLEALHKRAEGEKWLTAQMKKEDKERIKTAQQEREALLKLTTDRIVAEMKAERIKAQAINDLMSGAAQSLGEYFGFAKELAIAQAVINTYEGATKALAQGGIIGVALAAIVIAAGVAQIATISSQEAPSSNFKGVSGGSGFDDPGNDQAARLGGRRWALDMVGEFTRGTKQGWAEGMSGLGGNTTNSYDNRRTYNVNMHGAGLIDPNNIQMVKQLKRTLDVIDTQIEGQRTIARVGRTAG